MVRWSDFFEFGESLLTSMPRVGLTSVRSCKDFAEDKRQIKFAATFSRPTQRLQVVVGVDQVAGSAATARESAAFALLCGLTASHSP